MNKKLETGAFPGPAPQAGPVPSLLEQLTGVFSEPVVLFRRLHARPAWQGALLLTAVVAVLMTAVWAWKVDADSLFRAALGQGSSLSGEQLEQMLELQKKFIIPGAIALVLLFLALGTLLSAVLYWLIGTVTAQGEAPRFSQALAASVVPNLVTVPYLLLLTVICLVHPIGGATPEKLAPTSLGYFLAVDNARLQTLLYRLDFFNLALILLTFLAARHLLRLRGAGALACAAVPSLCSVILPALLAR